LEGANLNIAHLEGAILMWAYLEAAFLLEAHLDGADLRGAHGLTVKQLQTAVDPGSAVLHELLASQLAAEGAPGASS
jgi:uncharacterized protein YjbI with pentapeptide repeats